MANKSLLVLLGLAMVATTASASTYIDAFENFLAAPGPDGLINMVANQGLALVEPILIGILALLVDWSWDNMTMDMAGNEFTFPQLFGLAGVGNKKQLIDAMVQFTHFSIIE